VKRTLVAIISVISVVASASALAQTNTQNGAGPNTKPAPATENTGRAADTGNTPASGSLMQQREKGMSPQAASGGTATGKMKQ
jgi:predicted small secreted protein